MNNIKRFPTNLYISKSEIDGDGLFSKEIIPTGKIICQIANLAKFDNTEKWINEWGHKINHSDEPTAEVVLIGNKCLIKAIEEISKGEEITTDYRTIPDFFDRRINEAMNLQSLKWYNENLISELGKICKIVYTKKIMIEIAWIFIFSNSLWKMFQKKKLFQF